MQLIEFLWLKNVSFKITNFCLHIDTAFRLCCSWTRKGRFWRGPLRSQCACNTYVATHKWANWAAYITDWPNAGVQFIWSRHIPSDSHFCTEFGWRLARTEFFDISNTCTKQCFYFIWTLQLKCLFFMLCTLKTVQEQIVSVWVFFKC